MGIRCSIIGADTPNWSDDHENGKSGFVLTPARRRGVELLDDPHVDAHDRRRAQDDIRRSNVWLGGLRAALAELRAVIAPRDNMILLDVGTGLADILAEATRDVRKSGGRLTTIGVDGALSLLATARGSTTGMVCADALALPFRDGSVDVAMCSQLLHHFTDADVELAARGAPCRDARSSWTGRSWFAAAGFGSFVSAGCDPRHDGVVSRCFRRLRRQLRHVNATGASPRVSRRLGWLTARWTRTKQRAPRQRALDLAPCRPTDRFERSSFAERRARAGLEKSSRFGRRQAGHCPTTDTFASRTRRDSEDSRDVGEPEFRPVV
jgi:hypothetical protein